MSTTDPRGFSATYTWSPTRKLLFTALPATPQGPPVVTNVYDARDWLKQTLNPLQQSTLESALVFDAPGRDWDW